MPGSLTSPDDLPSGSGFRMLLLGDVMGMAGVKAVTRILPDLRRDWGLDFVIVNGENSNGFGMIPESATNLLRSGVDVLTGGNHTLRPSAIHGVLEKNPRVLRPHNLGSATTPGRGFGVYESPGGVPVAVINLIGQVFMEPADSPFNAFDTIYAEVSSQAPLVIVDFHAEATGEKVALAHHCDGRASFIGGTHTHVPTADARILPGGTGAITDLGLCGASDAIIGMEPEAILGKSRHAIPSRFNPARGQVHLQGVLAFLDPTSGKTLDVLRVDLPIP